MTRYATLAATAHYLPERELSNRALGAVFPGETISKLEAATGILTRFHAPPTWAASDLALPAARIALERAGLAPDQIDVVIVGTDTPDYLTPATSVVLQHKLGATRAGTFDVGCACASFPTAISIASGLISTNEWIEHVLVVGAYAMHKLADPADPTRFFYGDGAGAAVLRASDRPGVIASAMRADGSYAPRWGIFAGGSAEPATEAAVRDGRTNVRLVDRYPAEINDEGWPILVRDLAARGGFEIRDIGLAIFTQVRSATIDKVMTALELPADRTHKIMHKWGYTGSACVGMALDDALALGKARPGDLIVLVGSGVGYNQAAVALRL
jgi:3-oxoacyl-[acyl-carrier-protein] synthase-3